MATCTRSDRDSKKGNAGGRRDRVEGRWRIYGGAGGGACQRRSSLGRFGEYLIPPCRGYTVPWLLFISIIMYPALIAYCRAYWKIADAKSAHREEKREEVTVTSIYMSQENT